MTRENTTATRATLTAFTVCADDAFAALGASAGTCVPGVEWAGDVPDYLSLERKPHFPASFKQTDSCIAIVDFDRNWDQALQTVEALTHVTEPRIISVGLSSRVDTDGLLVAMRAGCSEFLRKPVQLPQLKECLEHWKEKAATKSRMAERSGRVVPYFGAKGGVGVTTLLVHLATELVSDRTRRVLLIDLRRQLGHVALYLGIKENQYGFSDLVRSVDRLDSDLTQGFVLDHSSGLHILASPTTDNAPVQCSASQIQQILDLLRTMYDIILIDAGVPDGEVSRALMEFADEVGFVTTAEVAAVRDLAAHLDFCKQASSRAENAQIILNRAVSRNAITAEEISKAAQRPVSLSVPEFPHVAQAIGTGEPFTSKKRNDFTKAITALAEHVAPAEVRTETRTAKKRFALWG